MAQGTVLPAFIRAEYDSSSQGFRDLERNAALAGQNIKQQFESSFGEIQSVVQKALSIPRNAAGALDFDTAGLRRAADDAQALSIATREVARAAEIAARATGDTSEATRIYVQAARAAATGAEAQSRELNAQAATYERLQKEIDQTVSSTQRLVTTSSSYSIANRGVTESTKAMRQATVQAGQQLQDIVISLQGGQRASTVLSQQLPQLALAFQNVGGRIGAAATVLSGPWGVGLALGGAALGLFIDKLIAGSDAAENQKNKFVDLTSATDRQRAAIGDLRAAIDEYNKAQEQQSKLTEYGIQLALSAADADLKRAIAKRQLMAVQLREEQDRLDYLQRTQGGNVDASLVQSLEAKIKANGDDLARLQKEITNRTIELGNYAAKAIDPLEAIRIKYDNIAAAADRAARKSQGIAFGAPIADVQAEIARRRRAEEAAARTANRTGGADPTGELTRFINPVTGGRVTSTPGIRRDPVTGKQAQHNGVDIAVPIGTQVRAPAGGTIIESGNVPGYGNVVYIDHGAGTVTRLAHLSNRSVAKGDIVSQGDVIGLSGNTGKSTGPHVHWETRVNNRVTDPRGRRLPTDPLGAAQNSVDMAAEGERAARALQDAIDQAGQSVTRLRGQFDQAPRDIDRASVAAVQLDRILKDVNDTLATADLTEDQRAALEAYRAEIEKIQKVLIPEFLQRPIDDRIKGMDRELQLQKLLLEGREDEASLLAFQHDLMRQLNVETQEQLEAELKSRGITQDKLDLMYAQFQQLEQNTRIQQRMDRAILSSGSQLRELDRAHETLVRGIADLPKRGFGALKDIVSDIRQQANEIIARRIADKVFGDVFARLEDQIRGKKPIDAATENYVQSTVKTTAALINLTDSFMSAAATFQGYAANDNIASVIPTGPRFLNKAIGANFEPSSLSVIGERAIDPAVQELKRLNKSTADANQENGKIFKTLASLMEGAFMGQTASSLIFGNKGSGAGSAIGGAIGKELGKEFLTKGLESISKGLGKFAGPLGSIAGGLLGGAIGGLFTKTPRGYATIGGGSDGRLMITGTGGNSNSAIKAGNQAAGATLDTLDKIAEALGGTYDASRGSVSIGRSGDSWHVDTSGRGRLKKSQGGFDFDDDYEAAVRFATMDLIKDGVIAGLRASTQRLLQQGKDIDGALQKALDFESVFTRLKEFDDPVGAAIDTLDKEFIRLKKIFGEAGASAAEYADLERLYGIERAQAVKEAAERVTASLQSLYDDLTIGDNGRSLRDRLSAAQAAYDPLKARVLAGDKTAYDDFANAAQALLDIQRQFSGSQTPYFNLLDEITKITRDRIEAEKNVTALAANRDSPFSSTGKATGANDNAPVVSAIQQQTSDLLRGFAAIVGGGSGVRLDGFTSNPFL